MNNINREHLKKLNAIEEKRFLDLHPKSGALFEKAKGVMPGGVPMSWMAKWPGAYPIFVESAAGSHFIDVDGNLHSDQCSDNAESTPCIFEYVYLTVFGRTSINLRVKQLEA